MHLETFSCNVDFSNLPSLLTAASVKANLPNPAS